MTGPPHFSNSNWLPQNFILFNLFRSYNAWLCCYTFSCLQHVHALFLYIYVNHSLQNMTEQEHFVICARNCMIYVYIQFFA